VLASFHSSRVYLLIRERVRPGEVIRRVPQCKMQRLCASGLAQPQWSVKTEPPVDVQVRNIRVRDNRHSTTLLGRYAAHCEMLAEAGV
jgi:hypothetical protein